MPVSSAEVMVSASLSLPSEERIITYVRYGGAVIIFLFCGLFRYSFAGYERVRLLQVSPFTPGILESPFFPSAVCVMQ